MVLVDTSALVVAIAGVCAGFFGLTLWVIKTKFGIDEEEFKVGLLKRKDSLLIEFSERIYTLSKDKKSKEMENELENFLDNYHKTKWLSSSFDKFYSRVIKAFLVYIILTGVAEISIVLGGPNGEEVAWVFVTVICGVGILFTLEILILSIIGIYQISREYLKIKIKSRYFEEVELVERVIDLEKQVKEISSHIKKESE